MNFVSQFLKLFIWKCMIDFLQLFVYLKTRSVSFKLSVDFF